jgi:wyosine [tRNA(Phe)-imidazoG37] synthetase (radical SAM superfamily)
MMTRIDMGALFQPDQIVKSCPKLESGLYLSVEGLRACTRGALATPLFFSSKQLNAGGVSKEQLIDARKHCISMLNDLHSAIDCKNCMMVEQKRYGDIRLFQLGHIDLQHYSVCNLRCRYCNYTRTHVHVKPQYDALKALRLFGDDDVLWNAHVDFAGGEPTLLPNLEEYLEFFRTRRIRVLMHTNAVRYHQAIYDGLCDGSIYWVTTSLDAGTPSTFKSLRGRDRYLQVLENLCRYAVAGSKSKGMLAVKYIFCDTNCGPDDIAGFAYTMLAIRPQKVWLTLDFSPLLLKEKSHDYRPQIEGYATLYTLLKKHGIEAFHYYEEAIGSVSREGREIMEAIHAAIRQKEGQKPPHIQELFMKDFRKNTLPAQHRRIDRFQADPLRLEIAKNHSTEWCLAGKRVLLAPACAQTERLLLDSEIMSAEWIGLLDRNPIHHGKKVRGISIHGYEEIPDLNVDHILIASPEKHRADILETVVHYARGNIHVAELIQ